VHHQAFADKIDILLGDFLLVAYLDRPVRTSGGARREFSCHPDTIVAFRIEVRNKILKYNAERAGDTAGFTAGATHLCAPDVPVGGALKGIMITGIHARRLFAMAADGRKGRVFAQGSYAVILRMVKVIAGNAALLTAAAYI